MYMKNTIYINTILMAILTLALGTAVFGQGTTPTETPQPAAQKPQDMRTVVLGQLGLSRDQLQQIRRLNVERKPIMDDAQKRLRAANQALDQAIYADQMSEGDVQARLKEAQAAQAEVARLRFMNEFAVRRILTPEQLVRFRDLRQKFEETRENMTKKGSPNGGRPIRDVKQDVKQVTKPNQLRP